MISVWLGEWNGESLVMVHYLRTLSISVHSLEAVYLYLSLSLVLISAYFIYIYIHTHTYLVISTFSNM